MEIKVIFEDKYLAVVDKPAGVPVYPAKVIPAATARHPSSKVPPVRGNDMLEVITERWPEAEPAHRLDNDTSGLLLIAKDKGAFEELRAQFSRQDILKQYTALVIGETADEGVIESPIIHDPKNKKRMKVQGQAASGKGQDAWTSYKLLKKYLGGRYSLVEVTIRTGVRHQIRVHMASIGHPLAGDRLYQNKRQRERDGTGLKRHFLHASKIGLHHPKNDKWMEFSCPLASELENVLTKLA